MLRKLLGLLRKSICYHHWESVAVRTQFGFPYVEQHCDKCGQNRAVYGVES
jgi:hypothetical protein